MREKTILIVDDTVENLDILTELLSEYDTIDVLSGLEALEVAKSEKVDLILLDIMMPNMDGYEVCKRLKSNHKTKDIPIIFITAKSDEESIEMAYEVGGADYVTKPFLPKEIKARIKKELKIQDMMNELKLMASTDPMTKLYNRRYFSNISTHTLDLAKREKLDLSIIMFDIDNFKKINDTYGHKAGDEVIIALANKLIETKRKSDISCRFGGEEFVALLPNTSIEGAKTLANKIREVIENYEVISEDKKIKFTISLGVSKVDVENENSIEEALKRADDALYEAKNSGKNRVCVKL
jgi:diguanylate cyclase (GGDEF)-like protein